MKSCHICRWFFLEHQMGEDYSLITIHKVSCRSMMTETFCMLNISKFFCKLYRDFIQFSNVALICCSKQQLQQHVFTKKKKNTDKCVHHHHVKQTLAVHKHTRYTTMTPPHCESPHSAVVLSAAGPAGCGSRSLGQCAGWTGPPDTVTGCRSGSHWNTGRKGTDPVLYSNYHVSQKRQ